MDLNDLFIEQVNGGDKKKDDIISMLFDPFYRSMIGSDDGMPLVELIVAVVLEKSLKEIKGNVKHLSKELLKKHYKDMDNHVDVLLDYDKEKLIVEMNSKKIMINRNYIYLFKVAAGTLKVGDKTYKNIKKTVLVNFNKENIPKDNFIDIGYLKNQDGKIMSEIIKVININIAKAFDKSYTYLNEFEENIAKICRIFRATNSSELKKEIDSFMSKEEAKNFVNKAKELSSDDEMVYMFDQENMQEMIRNTELEEATEKGIKQGIEQGIEQGSQENAIENAKNALKLGLDDETISKITNLSVEIIKSLRKETNN